MKVRQFVRPLVVLAVAGFLTFEAALWFRTFLTWRHLEAFPQFGVTSEGEPLSWEYTDWEAGRFFSVTELDERRGVVGIYPRRMLRGTHPIFGRVFVHGLLSRAGDRSWPPWGERFAFLDREEGRPDFEWYERIENNLNGSEAQRRKGARWIPRDRLKALIVVREPAAKVPPIDWKFENGRFVCRDRSSGEVLAGFGPDGYASGALGADGDRFGNLTYLYSHYGSTVEIVFGRVGLYHRFVDEEAAQLVALRLHAELESPLLPLDSREPIQVSVTITPLGPETGGAAEMIKAIDRGTAALIRHGEELVVGTVSEIWVRSRWGPGGELLLREPASRSPGTPGVGFGKPRVCIVTLLAPVHPTGGTVRFRIIPKGGPAVVTDVEMVPESTGEKTRAAVMGSIVLLRAPVLNLASYLSRPPRDWSELEVWWWRDPYLAGQRYAGWLLASFGVALLCAWWAYRQARMRCARRWFWPLAALILGPLGLIWMRLVVPKLPVEEVDGRRRAVNMDEPWPEPEETGVEVFA